MQKPLLKAPPHPTPTPPTPPRLQAYATKRSRGVTTWWNTAAGKIHDPSQDTPIQTFPSQADKTSLDLGPPCRRPRPLPRDENWLSVNYDFISFTPKKTVPAVCVDHDVHVACCWLRQAFCYVCIVCFPAGHFTAVCCLGFSDRQRLVVGLETQLGVFSKSLTLLELCESAHPAGLIVSAWAHP